MATRANSAASQSQAQSVETRERQSMAPWLEVVEGRKVVRLENVSYLPAKEGMKSTFGGIFKGYVDPVTNQPCHFESRTGEMIAGGCPLRLFGGDADQVLQQIGGIRPGEHLLIELVPDATVAVYRKDDGEVAYLAASGTALTGAFRWEPTIVMSAF